MSQRRTLQQASRNGNMQEILDLLEGDVDLKATYEDGDTVLHLAFRNTALNEVELIQVLGLFLNRGVDINVKNKFGKTALRLAGKYRKRHVFDCCLTQGAKPDLRHKRLNTIAHFVVEEECKKFNRQEYGNMSEWLENESSNFVNWMASGQIDFYDRKNNQGFNALYLANDLNLQHILPALVRNVSDWSSTEMGETPLLCLFLDQVTGNYNRYRSNKNLPPVPPSYYTSRYAYNIVRNILECNMFIYDTTLATALYKAIVCSVETNIVEILLKHIPTVRYDVNKESLISIFTSKFHKWKSNSKILDGLKLLKIFIRKGANVNERDRHGETIARKLFRCYPKTEMLLNLMEGRADFSGGADPLESCLHFICFHGNERGMIDFLMNDNPELDVNARDGRGRTPLQIAVAYMNDLVAKALIKNGANVNDVYANGRSILAAACVRGQTEVVKMLIKRGADLSYRDARRWQTLLHLAVNIWPMFALLLENGLDINGRDQMGKTPLHYATRASIVNALVLFGAEVNALDYDGNTPLYDALLHLKNDKTMEALLMCGADWREPKVFALALEHFKKPFTVEFHQFRFIKRYLVKLAAVGLLDRIPHTPRMIEMELHRFYEQCQAEVALLDAFMVTDGTSLYGFLLKERDVRCALTNVEVLRAFVRNPENRNNFRIYYDVILGSYNDAVVKKCLAKQTARILSEIAGGNLPDLCRDKILEDLSDEDLCNFIEKYRNVILLHQD